MLDMAGLYCSKTQFRFPLQVGFFLPVPKSEEDKGAEEQHTHGLSSSFASDFR